MNFEELNKKAKEIACKNLEHGFDWQSFLVYSIAIMNEEKIQTDVDIVPESNIDEGIKELLTLFVGYINSKKSYCSKSGNVQIVTEKLDGFLSQIAQILHEIRLSCEVEEEKGIYMKFIEKIQKMG